MKDRRGILIVTRKFDPTADVVIKKLVGLGEIVNRINSDEFPVEAEFTGVMNNKEVDFEFNTGTRSVCGAGIKSAWFRQPFDFRLSDGIKGDSIIRFTEVESFHSMIGFLSSLKCFWLNRPDLAIHGSYKLVQLRVASRVGFAIPSTLVTNSPDKARQFIGECPGDFITKCITSAMIKSEIRPRAIFTYKLDRGLLGQIEQVRYCPTLFQSYVRKKAEVRVIVVCDRVFSFLIMNQEAPSELTRIDWRHYDLENVRHEKFQLPTEVEHKILELTRRLNLNFGAIDMILTPEDEFVFLELNTTGQWAWLEELTGVKVSDCITEVLANPPAATHY